MKNALEHTMLTDEECIEYFDIIMNIATEEVIREYQECPYLKEIDNVNYFSADQLKSKIG
jgi:hypothetical protein